MAYTQKNNPFITMSSEGCSCSGDCNCDSPLEKKRLRKTTKGKGRNFRTTEEGAGMTSKGVKAYRRRNPGSKLKTAVTGKVKKGSKAAKEENHFALDQKVGQVKEVKLPEEDGDVNTN